MWKPLGRVELEDIIAVAECAMGQSTKLFWDRIKIPPAKWQLSPWGDEGEGFWVVALVGSHCVYFNDIEEGFNISQYKEFGQIQDYRCNQTDLHDCICGFRATFFLQSE
ncbi:MAG TPA: hypothetical protein PKZ32_11085 [Candidatus Melainabacteria bacterium]|nr:hypothetical protein [Candidatus Melainabacteria bacterium]